MVWNVTEDEIKTRMIVCNEDAWPPQVDRSATQYVSKWVVEKNLDVRRIVKVIYDRTDKIYGTNEKPNQ
jgi:hypothetical protein